MMKEYGLQESVKYELESGKPVLIFDHEKREGETDMVFASQFVDFNAIKMLRKESGGLICTTIKESQANILSMPFLEELYSRFLPYGKKATYSGDMKYDSHSSFTFTINSRSTFTGISDSDRATTIQEFVQFIENLNKYGNPVESFYKKFRIPGHVSLLIAREGYFVKRKGHTELATYIVESAGLFPSATIAEMLGDDGKSMSRNDAEKYAENHDLIFIEGKEIIRQWANEKGNGNGGF